MERLSNLYASAVFDLAKQRNLTDQFLSQAMMLHESLDDPDFHKMLLHPHIPASEKHRFFKAAFDGKLHEDLMGLLFLAADKNREAFLLPALDALIEMIRQYKNIVTARVSSAVSLNEAQAENLKRVLSEKLRKTVELDLKVDSSLIGGPYIFVDGYYIDWTVKKRLRDLTVYMKAGCSS